MHSRGCGPGSMAQRWEGPGKSGECVVFQRDKMHSRAKHILGLPLSQIGIKSGLEMARMEQPP